MDFVIKSAQLSVEKYMTTPLKRNEAPSRCFISLDLKNMFNEVSREKIFEIISDKYPELLPLVTLLYKNPGDVFFKMGDGTWATHSMEEGVNQGCPLSSTLTSLVLHEVLEPLTLKLKARAARRLRLAKQGDTHADLVNDNNAGGESHPMGYIDDAGACVPFEDVLFFLEEFERLATPLGCHINPKKTRIMTTTQGTSCLATIRSAYGDATANDVATAIAKYSVKEVTEDDTTILSRLPSIRTTFGNAIADDISAGISTWSTSSSTSTPVREPHEETSGLRLLGQPLGPRTFAQQFYQLRLQENNAITSKLLATVSDHQTCLRIFSQCTLHKLPHLLGSEVMYSFSGTSSERWDDWMGPLATGISSMVESFLSKLTQRQSIPLASLLIAYITVSQGGLGMMDAATRAIPDFVITMSQAICYAEVSFTFNKDKTPLTLPTSLSNLFSTTNNQSSTFLRNFYQLLPTLALVGSPSKCPDPIDFFLRQGSFKSMCDRVKKAASARRYSSLCTIAGKDLLDDLDEILISPTSYPLIAMCRSIPSHRRPNDLFIISLKRKLHLELFDPAQCPTCLCGQTIDPFGKHTFCCRRVSKKIAHDRIRDDIAPFLKELLLSAGYIAKGSTMEIEPAGTVKLLPGLRPFDLAFRPLLSLKHTHIPRCPFTRIGFDVTITSPRGHVPPSKASAATSNLSANAAKHLIEKERLNLMRDGTADPYNSTSLTGEEIIHELLDSGQVLLPLAISPYGRWGPMFHKFLFGKLYTADHGFPKSRPSAERMYHRGMSHPSPTNLVQSATTNWKRSKPKTQLFYGHSYTIPTPKEYILQKLGLAIDNALSLHIRDVQQGHMSAPIDHNDEDFTPEPEHISVDTPVMGLTGAFLNGNLADSYIA